MTAEPIMKKNRGISVVWILPVIALCICGWLLYSAYRDAGVEIVIDFKDVSGIVPGKTQVMVRGIPVGLVKKIIPDIANDQIQATVKMDPVTADYLVEDTVFWVVRPELSASSIRGLDTILSGSYIGVQFGSSNTSKNEFTGLSSPPPVSLETPGLHLQLRAETLGSIQVGTGVYYRNIEIGEVQKHQLEADDNVLIDLFIKPEFSQLVREGSRFYNASGIQISGKLPNVKIQVESFASLLKGGILLHTPEQLQNTPLVKNGHLFSLYPDYEAASYGIPMTLTLASGEDIIESTTKVMYRGLEAGIVKEISIDDNEQKTVTAHILLDPRAELILRENTVFWLVKPEFSPSGIKNLSLLLSGAHITFRPGDGDFRNHFDILPKAPPQLPRRAGKSFTLQSESPSKTSAKSPIYYKNIQVGEVVNIDLHPSGRTINTDIFIYQEYLHLLSTKSVFWVHSGIELNAGFDHGLSFSTGPLAELLHGGISFTTPDKLEKKKNYSPKEKSTFVLYDSYKTATQKVRDLQQKGRLVQVLAESADSLSIGAPILHKNIKIGEIVGFRLNPDQQRVLVDCIIYKKFNNLVHGKTRFYDASGVEVSGSLSGISINTGSLQSILAGGLGSINVHQGKPLPPGTPYPLYGSLRDASRSDRVLLQVVLNNTRGLKESSPVKYKGITLGEVSKLTFSKDFNTIIATILVESNAAQLFTENTRIWVADAEINLAGIKNIETLVFGSYLDILPGKGARKQQFIALEKPPRSQIANRDGLGVILNTSHLGSLGEGSPVYYRQVQIGEVTGFELSPTYQQVDVFISIENRYKAVIRENTRFWNVSGAKIKGGVFSGLKITTESVEAIIKGGVALATPEGEKTGARARPGQHFQLYDEPEKEWLDWNPDVVLLELEDSNAPLGETTK